MEIPTKEISSLSTAIVALCENQKKTLQSNMGIGTGMINWRDYIFLKSPCL